MSFPKKIIPDPELSVLLEQISQQMGLKSIAVVKLDEQVLSLALTKTIGRLTEFERNKMRRNMILSIKAIIQPYMGNRKLNTRISLAEEGVSRSVYYEWKRKVKAITKKVKANKPISQEEEFIYMTEVLGFSAEQTNIMITIAANKDKGTFID